MGQWGLGVRYPGVTKGLTPLVCLGVVGHTKNTHTHTTMTHAGYEAGYELITVNDVRFRGCLDTLVYVWDWWCRPLIKSSTMVGWPQEKYTNTHTRTHRCIRVGVRCGVRLWGSLIGSPDTWGVNTRDRDVITHTHCHTHMNTLKNTKPHSHTCHGPVSRCNIMQYKDGKFPRSHKNWN